MGLELARRDERARAWLDAASRVTGVDVPRALERGGRALSRTDVLQPVLVAVGLASAEALARTEPPPPFVAGHSLGELTAACWSASLSIEEALELAALRGRLMARCAEASPGGMLAVRGVSDDELDRALRRAEDYGEVTIGAINTADEIVLTGDEDALVIVAGQLDMPIAPLRVAGAWHSEHMRPAVEPFREACVRLFADRPPRAPLVSACRGRRIEPEELVDALADGLVEPVRFRAAVSALGREGVDRACLPAPSRTTRSLLRRAGARRWALVDGA